MTDLKPILNTIANIAAVILALIYPNGEFIPPYNHSSLRQALWARRPEEDQCDIQLCWPAVASSVQHRWTSHHFIPGGKARQALAVIGQGLHYKGRSDHFWLDLLTGGVRVLRLGSGSKRGGLGTFVEMSQAVMPVIEPGMFVLYLSVLLSLNSFVWGAVEVLMFNISPLTVKWTTSLLGWL